MPCTDLALDHVALIVDERDYALLTRVLAEIGLRPNTHGQHPGQGTKNVFFCFDNAFLELLCVVDRAEANAAGVARLGLATRSDWRRTGAMPVGVALRATVPGAAMPFDGWNYLPAGASSLKPTVVAKDSDEQRRPLIFRGQRILAPKDWTDGRAGARQSEGGFDLLCGVTVLLPPGLPPGQALESLSAAGLLALATAPRPGVEIAFSKSNRADPVKFRWPQ